MSKTSRKVKKVEVRALVAKPSFAKLIHEKDLRRLQLAFNQMLKIIYSPEGHVVIYSYHQAFQERLEALESFMPAFELRRIEVDEQKWTEFKLEEALGSAIE